MQFKPQSAADIAAKSKPLTGNYPGRVHSAEDCTSKKDGTAMIKLEITVYAGEKTFEKTTYLHPKMDVLVYNFCQTTNLEREYNNGELSAELCEGKDVMVKLGIEKGKDGYADKSVIKDFLPLDTPETKPKESAPAGPPARIGTPAQRTPDPALDPAESDIPFSILFPILIPALSAISLLA